GVIEDELEYEVLDEPRGGLFGLGRADARIRARVKPLSREKPVDRRRRRSRADRPARARNEGTATEKATRAAGGARSSNRRRGGRGRGGNRSGGAMPSAPNEQRPADGAGVEEEQMDTQPVSAQAENAQAFVETLVRTMGFPATVTSKVD